MKFYAVFWGFSLLGGLIGLVVNSVWEHATEPSFFGLLT